MLNARRLSLAPGLFLSFLLLNQPGAAQQPSNSNPNSQDVPQHQPPATNNPDVSKQRRPGPIPPRAQHPDQNSPDVPHQEPGPDNPDVGNQRNQDKTHVKGATPNSGAARSKQKKGTAPQKRAKAKASSTASSQ